MLRVSYPPPITIRRIFFFREVLLVVLVVAVVAEVVLCGILVLPLSIVLIMLDTDLSR